jgi:hypothetical protein
MPHQAHESSDSRGEPAHKAHAPAPNRGCTTFTAQLFCIHLTRCHECPVGRLQDAATEN